MKRFRMLVVLGTGLVGLLGAAAALASGSGGIIGGDCLAHHPNYIEGSLEVQYTQGCTGHDEPELFPISSAPGSARELTWRVILPKDGPTFAVDATGPTFWFGGTVSDPRSLLGQAFVELQFYPDSIVTSCSSNGGFEVKFAPNTYTACSPVWTLRSTGQKGVFHEPPAMNAMLTDGTKPGVPLVMHGGDEITVHWYTTSAQDGFHVTVRDLTAGGSGTIVLDSTADGPLMPAFDTQEVGNALGWGVVDDAPNGFVWEIGHTSPYTHHASQFCLPGQTFCESYHDAAWADTIPITIESVTFAKSVQATKFGVVSDFGGRDEVNQNCGAANYGKPYCIYPWFTLGKGGFHYGVDFADTVKDYGQVDQFEQKTNCGGPFGANTTYCSTVLP